MNMKSLNRYTQRSAKRLFLVALLTGACATGWAADGKTVHGRVVDSDGQPIAGAYVNVSEEFKKVLTEREVSLPLRISLPMMSCSSLSWAMTM